MKKKKKKRKLGRKGFVDLCVFEIIALTAVIAAFVALPFMTPKFRVRKAVEKCQVVEELTEEQCKSSVAGMSKAEVLDYIKDK